MRKAGVVLFCCLVSSLSWAQLASTTSLVGNVTDGSGAFMTNVTVRVVNEETKDEYTATTNNEGFYSFQFVRVGVYAVTASAPGFQTLTKKGILVEENQSKRTDFVLTLGRVEQVIEVTAGTPPIATDDPTLSETIGVKQTVDLPINGRDSLKLATITPGVLPGLKSGASNPGLGEDFEAAGAREIQNNVSLDGVSIMNNLASQATFKPSTDAIQEVSVQTGTYGAQYGGYLGLQLNLVTKSGTNALHGTAFEFLRNNAFDARGYFQRRPNPQSPYHQNQFGFVLGGPVMLPKLYSGKDRTFFMVDYEGLRQSQQTAQLDTVLTPLMRKGNFSEISTQIVNPLAAGRPAFPGNVIPQSMLSTQALGALQYMPAPTLSGTASNYLAAIKNGDNNDQIIGRLDQNLGERSRVFFRYAQMNATIVNGSTNPSNGFDQPVQNQNFVVGETQILSRTMVNDIRFGRQHSDIDSINFFTPSSLSSAGTALGIPGFASSVSNPGLPDFEITGFMPIGGQNMSSSNWYQKDTTWQGVDVFSYSRGSHSIAAGSEIRKMITLRTANNNPRGQFNFSGTISGNGGADLLLGLPLSVVTPGQLIPGGVAEYRDGFFFTDRWQLSARLTLSLGLRYELPTVPESTNGFGTILDPTQSFFIPTSVPQKIPYIRPSHNDWSPRAGLAFRATKNWVIRGGTGIYYNANQTNTFTLATTNPPFSTIYTYSSSPANPTVSLSNPTPASSQGAQPKPNAFAVSPNLPPATMYQWSTDVERTLWSNAGLDIQYLGSKTVHLDRSFYNNRPLTPGPGSIDSRRPNQLFSEIRTIQNDEIATYNGLNIVLRQNQFHDLTMLLAYSWAHSLDVSSDSNNGGAPMNPYNWRLDYDSSNWDVRHRLVSSFSYNVPFFKGSPASLPGYLAGGWQVNGIITAQAGMPFTVTVPGDPSNTGYTNQRPLSVGRPSANCGQGHLTGCVATAAFAIPAQYTFGNVGRNTLRGPDLSTVDLSLFKNIPLHEKLTVQVRAEAFNLLNHPSFANPSAVFGTSAFGNITATTINNRQLQLAAKINF